MKSAKGIAIACAVVGGLWTISFATLYGIGFRWYRFPSASMEPTIPSGSHAVGYLSESVRDEVERFDIVIFRAPRVRDQIYAQRVVGLPGERIEIGREGVRIDGKPLLYPDSVSRGPELPGTWDVVVPEGAFFILGDNPQKAADSRTFGSVGREEIVGKILFKR